MDGIQILLVKKLFVVVIFPSFTDIGLKDKWTWLI